MEARQRQEILKRGGPQVKWSGEPALGSYYDEKEIEAVVRTIRESMDPTVGFGGICPEIERFEAGFASYCGAAEAVTINGAGTGLDMAMR